MVQQSTTQPPAINPSHAEMEYTLLVTSSLALGNMLWTGYGAFFAINTLLATALGFAYSEKLSSAYAGVLTYVRLVVPVIGVFIAAIAHYAAGQLSDLQRLTSERGVELEAVLGARIFQRARDRLDASPRGTRIGCLLFGILWVVAVFAWFVPT